MNQPDDENNKAEKSKYNARWFAMLITAKAVIILVVVIIILALKGLL